MSDHETYFDSLIGKRVLVIWHDAGNDWIAFRLIWEDCGNVKLQGVESPDGNRHDGSCVICPVSDIRDMIEWKEEIDNHEHKPYYYIYRVGNGNSNVKHSTIESAQKEVERLERELEQERQDRKQADLDTIRALGDRNEARAELEQIKAILADPLAVHLNMLRGTIQWTPANLRHLMGES